MRTITEQRNGRTITWTAGVIGTSAWSAEREAERKARTAERSAALRDACIVEADGAFVGCAAPIGADERTDGVTHTGSATTIGTPPMSVRRLVRDARKAGTARRHRRSVMAAARQAERQRRHEARQAAWTMPMTPIDHLALDIADGRHGLDGALITERVVLRALDDDGYSTSGKRSARRDAKVTIIDAPRYMVALERLVRDYDNQRRSVAAVMADEPHGSGRGTVTRAASSVNGTETRVAERWHGTPRHAVMTRGETRHGVTCVLPIDWACYRVEADGTRTALVTTTTARKRKAAAQTSAAAHERAERRDAALDRLAERAAELGAQLALDGTLA